MPVDRCTRENSCLQVLAGSHKLGRVDHFLMGDQSGADPDKVEMAKKFGCEHLHVEIQPGSEQLRGGSSLPPVHPSSSSFKQCGEGVPDDYLNYRQAVCRPCTWECEKPKAICQGIGL